MMNPARKPASGAARYCTRARSSDVRTFHVVHRRRQLGRLARRDRSPHGAGRGHADIDHPQRSGAIAGAPGREPRCARTSTSSAPAPAAKRASSTAAVRTARSWLIQLQPLHTGTIDIPPIAVGSEQTAAIEIDVTKASPQADEADIHACVPRSRGARAGKPVYVQQQIAYTVRLFYDDTVQSGDLAAPDPENAIVEQLGTGKSLHGDTQRARIQCDRAPLRDCARKKRRPAHSSGKLSRHNAGCVQQPGQLGSGG